MAGEGELTEHKNPGVKKKLPLEKKMEMNFLLNNPVFFFNVYKSENSSSAFICQTFLKTVKYYSAF